MGSMLFTPGSVGYPQGLWGVLILLGQPEETIPALELPWALLVRAAAGAALAGAAHWGRVRCLPCCCQSCGSTCECLFEEFSVSHHQQGLHLSGETQQHTLNNLTPPSKVTVGPINSPITLKTVIILKTRVRALN